MDGWNGKILWIDLTEKNSRVEEISSDVYTKFVGGKGLGAYLLYREVAPRTDPLGPSNVLFFMSGPLQGLPAPFGTGGGGLFLPCSHSQN